MVDNTKIIIIVIFKLRLELKSLIVRMGGWVVGGWVCGGLNDNNAILTSVNVVVEVGVELGNTRKEIEMKKEKKIVIPRQQMRSCLQKGRKLFAVNMTTL